MRPFTLTHLRRKQLGCFLTHIADILKHICEFGIGAKDLTVLSVYPKDENVRVDYRMIFVFQICTCR